MIIPMIDIIFFLLVFFMMSMLTMVVQRSIDLNLPQTATAKIVVKETLPVSITAGGGYLCGAGKDRPDGFPAAHGDREGAESGGRRGAPGRRKVGA